MIRKPKIHPKYNINLVGISFRERWNIVEFATKSELETYIANFKHIKKSKKTSHLAIGGQDDNRPLTKVYKTHIYVKYGVKDIVSHLNLIRFTV